MRKISILLTFFSALFITISCANSDAKAKINEENLEEAKSRDTEIKKGAATIAFDKVEYNFGTVNEGDIVETTFKVTNAGKTDLIITNAQASCGCTVPTWPKDPIKPGDSADIEVSFNTSGKPNRQSKSITLTTNTESGMETLILKGSVIPKTN